MGAPMLRLSVALVALLGGCFDLSSDTALSPCEQMVQDLCQRACECADQECYTFLGAWNVSYSSQAACEAAERGLWCADTSLDMDFVGCDEALAGASCGQDYDLSGLELPEACGDMVGY